MWSQWTEMATKGITDALEKTGEAITQAATQPKPRQASEKDPQASTSSTSTDTTAAEEETNANSNNHNHPSLNLPNINIDRDQVMKNLQMGWSSVVESTKRTVEATKEAVDMERVRLEQNFLKRNGFHKRDPKLPLDVEALRDAEVVYITDRIITMSHPALASNVYPDITAERKLAAVGHLLNRRHDGRFLVWNLSEVDYDVSILDNQVMTFSFPGSPSPPLGLMLKLLVSMENWMKADPRNVAVVHCLTGKGRSSTVLAGFLCWMGEAGFGDINEALAYIARCKQISPTDLTIPSQRRYAGYFKNMLDGVRPAQPPLLLKRIIMSEAPKFAKGPPRETLVDEKDSSKAFDQDKFMGCAPYLQIFKAGKLVFTAAANLHVQQSEEELPFVQVMDGTIPFNVEQIIQGDVLIRCRHLTFKKQRVSMFRAAFHTGYVPPNVLRLTKSQLDGACTDRRFSDDFFLDLIFEKPDAETATKHIEEQKAEEEEEEADASNKEGDTTTPGSKTNPKGPVVKASSFDTMLHGDSRFWDVIADRRKEHVTQKLDDPMFGPTVGRRRGKSKMTSKQKDSDGKEKGAAGGPPQERSHLETFSIGNEFDFLPVESAPAAAAAATPSPKKPDMLMDALNALDEDDLGHYGTEEVVFSAVESSGKTEDPKAPVATLEDTAAAAKETSNPTSSSPTREAGEPDKTEASSTPAPSSDTNNNEDGGEDMEALLASADEDFGGLDLGDLDDDDDDGDIDDLEAMLAT